MGVIQILHNWKQASIPLRKPPSVIDTACDWVRPIYLSDHDIDVMDMQTKRAVLVHNQTWQANCQNR